MNVVIVKRQNTKPNLKLPQSFMGYQRCDIMPCKQTIYRLNRQTKS